MNAAAGYLCAFVLDALVASTAFAGCAWLALRMMPRANATTRYAVWMAVLAASVALPAVAPLAAATRPAAATTALAQTSSAVVRGDRPSDTSALRPSDSSLRAAQPVVAALPRGPHVSLPPLVAVGVAVVWSVGVLLLVARLAASLLYLERLKRDSLPFPLGLREKLPRFRAATKGSREVRLCVSEEIGVPVAIGLFDAMILVPKDLLDLEPAELDYILLHELAHLRRGDDWTNGLQRVAGAILFFSPAIVYVCARLDVEREVACDDRVLAKPDDALAYVHCLARMTEIAAWPRRVIAAPGIFATRRGMSLRIERLLDDSRDTRARIVPGPAVLAGAAIVVVALMGAYAAPSIGSTPTTGESAMPSLDSQSAPAEVSYAGKWHIETTGSNDSANLTLRYPPTLSNSSGTASLSALGLQPGTFAGSEHAVQFAIRRDAGTFVCKGTARAGRGDGTYRFDPNPQFVRDVVAAGYTRPALAQQIVAGLFDVRSSYVQGMAAAGVRGVGLDSVVELKIFGVTPEFVASTRADFPDEPTEGFAFLSMSGVTHAYVDALRRAGVPNLTVGNVSALRAAGIDQAFVERLATAGPHGLTIDEIVRLKATSSP